MGIHLSGRGLPPQPVKSISSHLLSASPLLVSPPFTSTLCAFILFSPSSSPFLSSIGLSSLPASSPPMFPLLSFIPLSYFLPFPLSSALFPSPLLSTPSPPPPPPPPLSFPLHHAVSAPLPLVPTRASFESYTRNYNSHFPRLTPAPSPPPPPSPPPSPPPPPPR